MEIEHRLVRVAILGSGKGSNADAIIRASRDQDSAFEVCVVISSKNQAGIVEVGKKHGISVEVIAAEADETGQQVVDILRVYNIELLVLSGFMRMLSSSVLHHLHGKVINIHPALLPKFGGKGMFGKKVHVAVFSAGEAISGATVHWVNEEYDSGDIIAQEFVSIEELTSPDDVEQRVKSLEHTLYPRVVNEISHRMQKDAGRKR